MTVLISLAAAARNIPWQAWVVAGLFAAIGIYGCDQRKQGAADARSDIHQSNDKARSKADDAARTVENCNGRWDRARGVCVPDDGPSGSPVRHPER